MRPKTSHSVLLAAVVFILGSAGFFGWYFYDDSSSTKPAASPSPSVTEVTSRVESRKLGETYVLTDSGYEITLTPLEYRHKSISEVPADLQGMVYSAVQVKMCVQAAPTDDVTFGSDNWLLRYADGSQFTADHFTGSALKPEILPQGNGNVVTHIGSCVTGWITIPAPVSSPASGVVYHRGSTEISWSTEA